MRLEEPKRDPQAPLKIEDAQQVLTQGTWSDEVALNITVSDAIRAENFEATKQWIAEWPLASMLYQSPVTPTYWEGTQVPYPSIPFFVVAKAVNSLVPAIIKGLFYDDPCFLIQNRPRTSAQAARAIGAVINFQLQEMEFEETLRVGVQNAVLFGTNIWKYGWECYVVEEREFRRKIDPVTLPTPPGIPAVTLDADDDDNIEEVTKDVQKARPFFENIANLRHILVDPGLRVPDVRKGKYVVERQYLTLDQIEELRQRPGIKLPPQGELLKLFFPPVETPAAESSEEPLTNPTQDLRAEPRYEQTTKDPFSQVLEVLTRTDKKRVTMVLQRKLTILNDLNPYKCINYLSVNWWDVPESFYGIGLAKTIGGEQRLQQGITNSWLASVSLKLNGVYTRVRGKGPLTQNIRVSPGKVIEIEEKDAFKPLQHPDPVPEAGEHLNLSEARAEQISGAIGSTSQGIAGDGGHSNLARSAQGASMIASGAGSGIEAFIDKLVRQVFKPLLYAIHELDVTLLPIKQLKSILTDELQSAYFADDDEGKGDILELLGSQVVFTTLAGAKLQARRNMAQALPIMIQFLNSAPIVQALAIQNKKIDVQELIRMMFEVSDWRNQRDVVVDMTPQDQQRFQATLQGGQQAQELKGKMALQERKAQLDSQSMEDKNIARAANEVLRKSLEEASGTDLVTGQPGGYGFGSNE